MEEKREKILNLYTNFPTLVTEEDFLSCASICQKDPHQRYSIRRALMMQGYLNDDDLNDIEDTIQNRYIVLQKLMQGGMGTLYQAWDNNLNRMIAIKVVHKSQISAEILACRIQHKNIVTIYDAFEDKEKCYICMELIQGINLEHIVHKYTKIPWTDLKSYFLQMIQGLAFAHEKNIVHGDIKPANFLLETSKILETQQIITNVKIIDFGLAVCLSDTKKGLQYATKEFASPEQLAGQPLTPASDIYSLGKTFLYLLTGKLLPASPMNLKKFISDSSPHQNPVPSSLYPMIEKMLQNEPLRRYKNAGQLQPEWENIIKTKDTQLPYWWMILPIVSSLTILPFLLPSPPKSPNPSWQKICYTQTLSQRASDILIAWDDLPFPLQQHFPQDTLIFFQAIFHKAKSRKALEKQDKQRLMEFQQHCTTIHPQREISNLENAIGRMME